MKIPAWLAAAWRGMGPWKWIGVAAILTVIIMLPFNMGG